MFSQPEISAWDEIWEWRSPWSSPESWVGLVCSAVVLYCRCPKSPFCPLILRPFPLSFPFPLLLFLCMLSALGQCLNAKMGCQKTQHFANIIPSVQAKFRLNSSLILQGPKKWFAKCDKHYPSRSGQTSLATAVANFTKPRTSHFFDLCTKRLREILLVSTKCRYSFLPNYPLSDISP